MHVYSLRHAVKPGITGLAQIRGWRGETNSIASARMRIVCDLTYVVRASFRLDISILLLTLRQELFAASGS